MSIAIWPWVANACLHCPKETQEWNSNTALVAEEERMEGSARERLEVMQRTEKVKPEVLFPVLQERHHEVLLDKSSNPQGIERGRCQKPLTLNNGVLSAFRTKQFML